MSHRDPVIRDKFRAKKGLYADGDSIVNGDLEVIGALKASDFDIDLTTINVSAIHAHEDLVDKTYYYGTGNSLQTFIITDPIDVTASLSLSSAEYIQVPIGEESERLPADADFVPDGAIRYNTTANRFEGVVNSNWTGLGGVVDIDQDTYITAEQTSDDDTLRMYVADQQVVTVDSSGVTITGDVEIVGEIINDRLDNAVLYEPQDTDGGLQTIRSLTQVEYDNLTNKDSNTLYVVRDDLSSTVTLPTTFEDDVHIKGDLRVDGNAYLSAGAGGIINVGDNENDIVTFTADVDSDIIPNQNMVFDLGTTQKHWQKIYTHDMWAHGSVEVTDQLTANAVETATLTATGDVALQSNVEIDGELLVSALSAETDVVIKGNLIVDGEIEGVNKGGGGGGGTSTGSGDFDDFYTDSLSALSGTIEQDLHILGDLTVDGNVWFNAANTEDLNTIFIGDENTDSIVLNAGVESDLVSHDASTYKLGTATTPWKELHVDDIFLNGSSLQDSGLGGSFVNLSDTPGTYFANGGKFVRVNDTGTGLIFTDANFDFSIEQTELYTVVATNSADWIATTNAAIDDDGPGAGLYIQQFGGGSDNVNTYTIVHDLSSENVLFNVRDVITGQFIPATVKAITDAELEVTIAASDPNQYEVTVFSPSGNGSASGISTTLQVNDFYDGSSGRGEFTSLEVATDVNIKGNLNVDGEVMFAGDGSGLLVLGDEVTDTIICNAPISATSDLYVDGNVLFAGDSNGIILLGDSEQDIITYQGVVSGAVIPTGTDSQLGDITNLWSSVHAVSGNFDQVAYTPNNTAHWSESPPENIGDAIDRLAAVLYNLTNQGA